MFAFCVLFFGGGGVGWSGVCVWGGGRVLFFCFCFVFVFVCWGGVFICLNNV